MKMLRAVIFDMDGLMVDTEFLHHESFKKALAAYQGRHSDPTTGSRITLRQLGMLLRVGLQTT